MKFDRKAALLAVTLMQARPTLKKKFGCLFCGQPTIERKYKNHCRTAYRLCPDCKETFAVTLFDDRDGRVWVGLQRIRKGNRTLPLIDRPAPYCLVRYTCEQIVPDTQTLDMLATLRAQASLQ